MSTPSEAWEKSVQESQYLHPCTECRGRGKTRPPVRKRRSRPHETESDKTTTEHGRPYIVVCKLCGGTGLVGSLVPNPINHSYPRLAIVGGGIGGMALAVACEHRGIPYTLYERDAHMGARSQGYGLTLQQASKAIEGLGIFLSAQGITSTRHLVHNQYGQVLGEWGMRKWKQVEQQQTSKRKNMHIPRQTLRTELWNTLNNKEAVQWGHNLQTVSMNKSGGADLEFVRDGEVVHTSADLVVGADGIRSRVRECVITGQDKPLRYLGCMVILGICRADVLSAGYSDLLDGKTVFQTVNGKERIYVMPYDSGSVMWQISYMLPLAEAERLYADGAKALHTESLRLVEHWHAPVGDIIRATPCSLITGYPVFDRELISEDLLAQHSWGTLIGDAAHPMSPFKGQGANQAILDALSLAREIDIGCGDNPNWRGGGLGPVALDSFEQDMLSRAQSKVRDSARAVELLHSHAVLHEGDEPRGRGIDSEPAEGWYLYIAESKSGKYYVGISTDVERRIETHNVGRGAQLAKFDGPFILRYTSQKLENQSVARKAEMQAKKWTRTRKQAIIDSQNMVAIV